MIMLVVNIVVGTASAIFTWGAVLVGDASQAALFGIMTGLSIMAAIDNLSRCKP